MKNLVMQPEFTNFCNFKCNFCPHSVYRSDSVSGNKFDREKGFMSEKLCNLFVENSNKYAKNVIIGFFGEPLLHPKFEKLVKLFPKKREYSIQLYTNWSLATKKNMEVIKAFDGVFISLDSSESDLWEKLCPGGDALNLDGKPSSQRYGTIKNKLEYWLKLTNRPPTQIVYVVSSLNEHDKEKFTKEWAPKLGLKDTILTKSVLSYGGVIKDKHMKENSCNVLCGDRFTVAWDGRCTPCNLDVNIGLNVGNLLKENDVGKIMKSTKWANIMQTIKNKDSICANCFDANNWTEHELHRNNKIKYRLLRIINRSNSSRI